MDDNDKLLLQLITDEDFEKIQDLSKSRTINFYRITGIGSWEIKHSNTIAWLLDPTESHNLGLFFFKKFITKLVEENPDYFLSTNVFDLLLNNFNDAEVDREVKVNKESKNSIDILFVSEESKFVLCIENKVWAGVGNGQLNRYYNDIESKYPSSKGYKKIYVLLSPDGNKVTEKESDDPTSWASLSYNSIEEILRSILKLDINQKMRYIIEDYIEHLEKEEIVDNPELDKIQERLFSNHKKAIELLTSYKKDQEKGVAKNTELNKLQGRLFLEYEDVIDLLVSFPFIQHNKKVIANYIEKSDISEISSTQQYDPWKRRFVFYTKSMDKHFIPNKDNPCYFKDGTKYKYWFYLIPQKMPRIYLELGFLGQDDETVEKFNKLLRKDKFTRKADLTAENNYAIRSWPFDVVDLDDIKTKDLEKITSRIKEILVWENELDEIFKSK